MTETEAASRGVRHHCCKGPPECANTPAGRVLNKQPVDRDPQCLRQLQRRPLFRPLAALDPGHGRRIDPGGTRQPANRHSPLFSLHGKLCHGRKCCMPCNALSIVLHRVRCMGPNEGAKLDPAMYKQMGAVIRRLREQRGWSLGDMAERMNYRRGADASGLQRLERGTKRAPLDLYSAVALALETPLSELIAAAERESGMSPEVLLPDEKRLLNAYRIMEPEARYHLDAVADALRKGSADAEETD